MKSVTMTFSRWVNFEAISLDHKKFFLSHIFRKICKIKVTHHDCFFPLCYDLSQMFHLRDLISRFDLLLLRFSTKN